jgi:hypothetical protein
VSPENEAQIKRPGFIGDDVVYPRLFFILCHKPETLPVCLLREFSRFIAARSLRAKNKGAISLELHNGCWRFDTCNGDHGRPRPHCTAGTQFCRIRPASSSTFALCAHCGRGRPRSQ